MRKLQSALRNDNRMGAVNTLQSRGGVSLVPSLAGQAMSSWTPRGLVGSLEQGAGPIAAILHPAAIPKLLAGALLTSPRLVGEGAYALGRVAGGVNGLGGLVARNPVLPPALRSAILSSATGPSIRMPQTVAQVYGQP